MEKTANKFKKYNPTTEQEHWFVDFFLDGVLVRHDWYETEEKAEKAKIEWINGE